MIRLYAVLLIFVILLSACDSDTKRRDDFLVHGIDVSHYQSYIDWRTVAEQDIHFAFVKASEGVTMRDTLFCTNWDEMKYAGIRRGAYHFFRPQLDAEDQARHFFKQVKLEYGDLPPVLDVEVLDNVSKARLIVGVKTWLWLAELYYGVKPILYTNVKFYNKYLAGHFNDYPLWIARYNSRKPNTACGRDWQFWQYGNRGQLAGIEGDVDFNVFNGELTALDALCLQPSLVISEGQMASR